MKKFLPLFLLFSLYAAACAGGSSRYGCPAEPGYSCKSVSEVYAEAVSGGGGAADIFHSPAENGKNAPVGKTAVKKLLKGEGFRSRDDARKQPGGGESTATRARDKETMPVYIQPPVIRLWIAPWQDARGVFHSQKYVYVLVGEGRWMIGQRTVLLGEPGGGIPENIRLRGTGRAP